jgi:hypothetical protein
MTPPILPDILARLVAATPGPWHRMTVPDGDPIDGPTGGDRLTNCIGAAALAGAETFIVDANTDADADLIAHAPGDLAALVARVAELEAENAAMRAEVKPACALNLREWTSDATGWRYRFEPLNTLASLRAGSGLVFEAIEVGEKMRAAVGAPDVVTLAKHITGAISATVRAIALPGESFEDVRVGLDRPDGDPEAVTVDDLPRMDLEPLYLAIAGQTPALASLTEGDALALHYIAEAYHSDPWTVATWDRERLGFAIACLQESRKAEAEADADCASDVAGRPMSPVTVTRSDDTLSITTTAAAVDRLRDLVNSYGLAPIPIDAHLIANGLAVAMDDADGHGYTRKTQAGAALVMLWQGATP